MDTKPVYLMRMTINAPSKYDNFHHYDRKKVLVQDTDSSCEFVRVWFTEGSVISTLMRRRSLSKGW